MNYSILSIYTMDFLTLILVAFVSSFVFSIWRWVNSRNNSKSEIAFVNISKTHSSTIKHRKDGKLHCEDGPAVEYANGTKAWWYEGQKVTEEFIQDKRNEEPTIVDSNDYKAWYLNGKLHRTDGPAIEFANGSKEWWKNGELIKTEYHKEGNLHRTDGPAVEHANGDKVWYLNGKLHRKNGPAIEYANGNKHWYLNGKHHRTDGPAIEYADGYKEWWENGQFIKKI